VEPLVEVARHGLHNGQVDAIVALRKMRTREAGMALDALRRELGPAWEPYFR
jgi:hypothetical protein